MTFLVIRLVKDDLVSAAALRNQLALTIIACNLAEDEGAGRARRKEKANVQAGKKARVQARE